MFILESKKRANKKYNDKTKRYFIRLRPEEDGKVIAELDKQENKTDFIRQLILDHIRKKSK